MSYIFLDESGDLGFRKDKKSSQFFIITVLATDNKRRVEKVVKKVHSSLRKKVKRISGGVLHSHKEKPETRKKLLKLLSKESCNAMTIILNKKKVYTHLQNEKHILYNYVTNILLERIMSKKLIKATNGIELIAAKRETNKFLNLNFKDYLQKQIKNKLNVQVKIEIKTPSEEKSLQATDFICWACFRKYELKDEEYYRIIKNLIIEENFLYK